MFRLNTVITPVRFLGCAFIFLIALLPVKAHVAAFFMQPLLRFEPGESADAIIVLGHRPENGELTQQGRARLHYALDLYNRGVAPGFIVSGG